MNSCFHKLMPFFMAYDEKSSGNGTRYESEKKEDLTEKRNSAPKARFQQDQQVQEGIDMRKTETPKSDFVPKTVKASGSALKQEIAAKVVSDNHGIGGGFDSLSMSAGGKRGTIVYSGDGSADILGNVASTPRLDKNAQGKTRVDKRLSDVNKEINYLVNEQVDVEYKQPAALAESDTTVGYNGNPKNKAARATKKNGNSSAELMFDRSVDYIAQDAFVFSTGQVVQSAAEATQSSYPTKSYFQQTDGSWKMQEYPTGTAPVRGNYAPSYLKVEFSKKDGQAFVSSFSFEEDDFSCNAEQYETVQKAGASHITDLNRSEIARQLIDDKAGSPNFPNFNPLGRSVDEPTRTVTFLRDKESTMGNTIFAAYKFAQKARAHYLSRTTKDGQNVTAPAIDALYGHLYADSSIDSLLASFAADRNTKGDERSPFLCAKAEGFGSAAVLLPVFDSPTKYSMKADILSQPRGLRMHLQTADNNMDPFRVKQEFAAALNSVDAYSTIDRGYDPMAPVMITDNVRLVYPYSWKNALSFTRTAPGPRTYSSKLFTYRYGAGNGMNVYMIKVGDPLLNGIAYFFDLHAEKFYSALADNAIDNTTTLYIPTVHSTTHFSLWDLVVCAATPYIIYERTNALKDILDFEVSYQYPFEGFVPIKDANPMNAVNYSIPDAFSPIQIGQMEPSSAIRWIWPEKFSPIGKDVLLPFYFSDDEFDFSTQSATAPKLTPNTEMAFNVPVIRSGVTLSYIDDFYGMDPKDAMLCLDMMVRVPKYSSLAEMSGYVYKYGQENNGIPVIKSSSDTDVVFTYQEAHATPRMIGYIMPAYAGECCVNCVGKDGGKSGLGSLCGDGSLAAPAPIRASSSMRAITYYADSDAPTSSAPLSGTSTSVNRAQAFTQTWSMARANSVNPGVTYFPLSIAQGFSFSKGASASLKLNYTSFTPYMGGPSIGESAVKYTGGQPLFSIHSVMWALLQKLPFILNPFDDVFGDGAIDPYGYAYLFNMAGFLSADYAEEAYNRANEKLNLGYGFVKDPFLTSSPLFRDAFRKTQIG